MAELCRPHSARRAAVGSRAGTARLVRRAGAPAPNRGVWHRPHNLGRRRSGGVGLKAKAVLYQPRMPPSQWRPCVPVSRRSHPSTFGAAAPGGGSAHGELSQHAPSRRWDVASRVPRAPACARPLFLSCTLSHARLPPSPPLSRSLSHTHTQPPVGLPGPCMQGPEQRPRAIQQPQAIAPAGLRASEPAGRGPLQLLQTPRQAREPRVSRPSLTRGRRAAPPPRPSVCATHFGCMLHHVNNARTRPRRGPLCDTFISTPGGTRARCCGRETRLVRTPKRRV